MNALHYLYFFDVIAYQKKKILFFVQHISHSLYAVITYEKRHDLKWHAILHKASKILFKYCV